MFGYVSANFEELTREEKQRYSAIYCGICRRIQSRCSNLCRVVLSYDTVFLAMLLMSLYEPAETETARVCLMHPGRPRKDLDNTYIQYAADMNVALAYHNCLDDWKDDGRISKKWMADILAPHYRQIQSRYPRQCQAMEACMEKLAQMEAAGESNPDFPATCFGNLMAELFVYSPDLWENYLRDMGLSLGRFIYLADAAVDFAKDKKHGRYNPFGSAGEAPEIWEEYLLMAMGRCSSSFEKLPLVQDKPLLDNIIYSGVWAHYRAGRERKKDNG